MKTLPSTGYAGFDEGLTAIFSLEPTTVEKVVAESGGRVGYLVEHLPRGIWRAAIALQDETLFKTFARANPRQLVPLLTEAKEITHKLFGTFLDNPEKLGELNEATAEGASPTDAALLDALNRIDGVTAVSAWSFSDGEVSPALRFIFTSATEKMALDTTLDWDDTIYLAYRLTQELRDELGNLSLIGESLLVNLDLKDRFGDRLAKRISNMQKDLVEIKEAFCKLGFSAEDFGDS